MGAAALIALVLAADGGVPDSGLPLPQARLEELADAGVFWVPQARAVTGQSLGGIWCLSDQRLKKVATNVNDGVAAPASDGTALGTVVLLGTGLVLGFAVGLCVSGGGPAWFCLH